MKKFVVAIAIAGITATATVAFAGILAGTGINGSRHDINVAPGGYSVDSLDRTCVFCHTPHNAQTVADGAPLWSRTAPATALSAYTWISPANAAIDIDDPLVGPSRLCMSCHDGVTAVDSHMAAKPLVGAGTVMAAANPATIKDLGKTHPIGFLYQDAMDERGTTELVEASKGFIKSGMPADAAAAANFDTNTRTGVILSDKTIADTLYSGFMTCASCHDVHNTVNAKPDVEGEYNYFLYAKQEGSAICLSCHVK